MKKTTSQKQMSPVNIEQNRAVGQDSFAEGSRMGREADKTHGYPGEAEQAVGRNADDDLAELSGKSTSAAPQGAREEDIRDAAYAAYQRRIAAGDSSGSETDDWLEAEAQLKRKRDL